MRAALTRLSQHTSGNKAAEEEAQKETDAKVKEIKDIGPKKGTKVVEDLLNAVVNVKPVPSGKA